MRVNTGAKPKNNKGKVNLNRNILLSIINLAAKEITGVSRLTESFGSFFRKIFTNNSFEGVRIINNGGTITIHVYLNVYYGVKVNDVVYRVQQSIKNGVSSMIDLSINSINVHVMGVDIK